MSHEESTPEPSSPLALVTEYLDEKGFTYTTFPEQNRISHTVWGRQTLYRSEIRINQNGTLFLAYIYFPIAVRDEKFRASANELLTRANYGLNVGGFEYDVRDGEIRYKVTQAIGDFPLEKQIVSRILRTAVNTADRYFPALVQHLYAGITPEDAVFNAEIDLHAEAVAEPTRPQENAEETPTPDSSPVDPTAESSDTPPRP